MDQFAWIIWLIVGTCLIIAEIFTLGFVLFWFGLGAMAAALAGLAGIGVGGQFLIFALVSISLTAMSRTIFARYFAHGESIKTGMDSLPGQIGTVVGESKGSLDEAAVKVFGSTWTAFPESGESRLLEGDKVEVVRVSGSSLYVRKVANTLPEWRSDS
jgi:membrane protein implicated in regulation of membrane protease activity